VVWPWLPSDGKTLAEVGVLVDPTSTIMLCLVSLVALLVQVYSLGYLHDEGLRTNVFHLPVRANGDGGVYTTAADIHSLWDALFAGRIVSSDTVVEMVRPRSDSSSDSLRYGLGFWLHEPDLVALHGFDAGSAFVSARDPGGRFTYTVISNKTSGAWPVSQRIEALLTQ